jgi:hypothetical protein
MIMARCTKFSGVALFLSLILFCVTSSAAEKKSASMTSEGHSAICQLLTTAVAKADTRALTSHVIGQKIDMNSIRRRLEKFTGETVQPDGLVMDERESTFARAIVRRWISSELTALGYAPTYEVFGEGANVIATIEGTKNPKEVIEVTAHFDSVGNPGADDNGSGLALVMELARLMKQFPPEKSVRFVLMDLEEKGMVGSRHHASQLKAREEIEDVIGVIVLDTIAWAPKNKKAHLIVMEVGESSDAQSVDAYKKRVNFAKLLMYQLRTIRERGGKVQFSVETEDAKPGTADHGSYWSKGFPAVLIGEAYEDGLITPHYHNQSDKVENLNWEYYTEVSGIVSEMLAYAAQSRLPDDFQLDEETIAALAAKDDTTLRPTADLPAALDRKPFAPPKPKPSSSSWSSGYSGGYGGGYSSSFSGSSYKPMSDEAQEVMDWIEKNLEEDGEELAMIVSEGDKHGAFIALNYSGENGKLKTRDVSKLKADALLEVADELMTENAVFVVVSPKKPSMTFSKADKDALIEVLNTHKYDDSEYTVRLAYDFPASLIEPEEYNTRLDMTKSTVEFLKNQIKNAGGDNITMVLFPSKGASMRGGIAIRDLDDVKWYTMNDDPKDHFERIYKEILDRGGSGVTPKIMQIDSKESIDPKEFEERILVNLWDGKFRAKIKEDIDYNPPAFLKGIKAEKK